MGLHGDFSILWGLVRRADSGEVGDLSSSGLLVEPLGVTLLGDLERNVGEDLDEGDRLIVGPGGGGMEIACNLTIGFERGDKGGDGDGRGVGKELGNLGRKEERSRPGISSWVLAVTVAGGCAGGHGTRELDVPR